MKTTFSLLFSLLCYSSFAQNVRGTVKDEDGNVLPFASILILNTPYGVTTNNDGQFSIKLTPGNYTIACRYIGYATVQKNVHLGTEDVTLNFTLKQQQLELNEIVISKSGEDPAYAIIRNAIRQRPYYEGQVNAFSADVYIKGMVKLLGLPEKVLGRKIEEKEKKEMALDSAGQGILYLSESLTHVSVQKPDKIKMEVISSRVSGSDGFGFDFPIFIDFYKNNVDVSQGTFSKRGFVSPIADNALNFYNYKFLGTFFENGKEVNTIRVIPKRNYEPLFSGIINITEGDWRIFSCKLLATSKSQLQILDTIEIAQIHAPEYKDIWRIRNQSIYFHVKQLGIEANGNFVNVYSNYDLDPKFPKGFFDRVIIKYDTAANKRTDVYWDSIRPVPLDSAEIKDYEVKDSLKTIRDSAAYNRDSLRRAQKNITVMNILWSGIYRNGYGKKAPYIFRFEPLLKTLQYNTVEGVAINPSFVISKYAKSIKHNVGFIGDVRYGFNNQHINPWAGFKISNANLPNSYFRDQDFFFAGGKRVSQFFKLSSLTGLANSISTLLYGRNDMKLYENYFFKAGYSKRWESGSSLQIKGLYEDRLPLNNTTDFLLNDKWKKRLTPNYPVEIMDSQFTRYQAVVLHASFSFQPGQRYIQYPHRKASLGSKYPVFSFQYEKGLPRIFGSDEDFDKWEIDIRDEMKLKLAGTIKYFFSTGGFLNSKKVYAIDYKHFYGSKSHVADEYVKAFQFAENYEFSNKSGFYSELHLEHHSLGLLTNKIPLLKKWNWYLVEGVNALHVAPGTNHLEIFAGLENIFKLIRFDAVMSLQNGYKPMVTWRIGFGGLLGDAFNAIRFSRNDKLIGKW